MLSDVPRSKRYKTGRERTSDSWDTKLIPAGGPGLSWTASETWRFKPRCFTSVWLFATRWWPGSSWLQAPRRCGVTVYRPSRHPPFLQGLMALFRNSRGGLVVKGCSSTFLSFLFSSEQAFTYSESQSGCLTPRLYLKVLHIYRSLRIPSLKFR